MQELGRIWRRRAREAGLPSREAAASGQAEPARGEAGGGAPGPAGA